MNCREIPQEGKPDRKVYRITANGRRHLLEELDNPAPSHKVRSEFLATMCFAHLMSAQQIETVLGSRIADIEGYLSMFDEFDATCCKESPAGMVFTVGLARAVMTAMKQYIEENGQMLVGDAQIERRSAAS